MFEDSEVKVNANGEYEMICTCCDRKVDMLIYRNNEYICEACRHKPLD